MRKVVAAAEIRVANYCGSTALPRNAVSEIGLFFEIRWVQQLRISAAARGRASMLLRAPCHIELVLAGLASVQGTPRFLKSPGSARVFLELECVRARRLRPPCSRLAFIDALAKNTACSSQSYSFDNGALLQRTIRWEKRLLRETRLNQS